MMRACSVNSRYAVMEQEKLAAISWWETVEKNFVQKAPQQQGSESPLTYDDIHSLTTVGERLGSVSRTGVVASSSATHEASWEQMETMVEKLGEELKKERQQQQELEQRLQNEIEHLKQRNQKLKESLQNETEHLKEQNQKLEESLRNEQTKVEQLKEQIQRSEQLKQENQ